MVAALEVGCTWGEAAAGGGGIIHQKISKNVPIFLHFFKNWEGRLGKGAALEGDAGEGEGYA